MAVKTCAWLLYKSPRYALCTPRAVGEYAPSQQAKLFSWGCGAKKPKTKQIVLGLDWGLKAAKTHALIYNTDKRENYCQIELAINFGFFAKNFPNRN